jgi:hypothetical protein
MYVYMYMYIYVNVIDVNMKAVRRAQMPPPTTALLTVAVGGVSLMGATMGQEAPLGSAKLMEVYTCLGGGHMQYLCV